MKPKDEIKEAKHAAHLSGAPEFVGWPKIARLRRDVVITEKIDGTNAAIHIVQYPFGTFSGQEWDGARDSIVLSQDVDDTGMPLYEYRIVAQSRSQLISPHKDNFGFALWVSEHQHKLVAALGVGVHFGEWWGQGIQRGYGLDHRRFSLFNTARWMSDDQKEKLATLRAVGCEVDTVPILWHGSMVLHSGEDMTNAAINLLNMGGSAAAPGFRDPEGIVVYHIAARTSFKVMCKNDEQYKNA